jgi:hypothetical protein
MAKKTTPKVEAQVNTAAVEQAPEFTPCNQCSYPADCARAAKCSKGFK